MNRVAIIAVVLAVGMVFSGMALAAETEHLISFQGQALDDAGDPVATGNLQVRIYDAATEGTLVYDSDQDFNSAIQEGIFDVLLGSGAVALNLDNAIKYYLEVSINGEEVVGDSRPEGRQEFWPGSGDHTHMHDADYVNVGESGSVTGGMIVDSTITSAKIVDGSIAGTDIANQAVGAAQLAGTNCSDVCVDANTTDCTSCNSTFVNEPDLDHLDAFDGSPASAVYVDVNGNVGIGTTTPSSKLNVVGSISVSDSSVGLSAYGGDGTGVHGEGKAYGGYFTTPYPFVIDGSSHGVYGIAIGANQSVTYGGHFESFQAGSGGDSRGVQGYAESAEGYSYGGYFTATANSGIDHYGGYFSASGANGTNFGVYSSGTSYGGYFTNSDATAGNDYAVFGSCTGGGTTNYGGKFEATGATTNNYGGHFNATGATTNYGVYGEGTQYGVYGRGASYGGYFETSSGTGTAVQGVGGNIGVGGYGSVYGVSGSGATGVYGSGTTCDFDAQPGGATNYCNSSSIRWKQNISEIDCALDKVTSLKGIYFDWIEEYGGSHDIGMVAEEVGKVVPEVVAYEPDGMYARAIDYAKLTPLLVQAIKEQNKIVEEQKEVIAQLKELVCLDHPDAEVCAQ